MYNAVIQKTASPTGANYLDEAGDLLSLTRVSLNSQRHCHA